MTVRGAYRLERLCRLVDDDHVERVRAQLAAAGRMARREHDLPSTVSAGLCGCGEGAYLGRAKDGLDDAALALAVPSDTISIKFEGKDTAGSLLPQGLDVVPHLPPLEAAGRLALPFAFPRQRRHRRFQLCFHVLRQRRLPNST